MEDNDIVELYWARDEKAISETAMKYGPYCKSIAYRILSDQEDADECLNDTYLGAWNAMPEHRPSRLAAFLGRIARNMALNRYDRNTAKKRNSSFDAVLSELEDCLCAPDTVESQVEAGETAAVISRYLRSIDADSRNIFLRRYWFVDSIADIANRFAMSDSKVKSLLYRTRKRLKAQLEKEGISL